MKDTTKRQNEVLDYLRNEILEGRSVPSVREATAHFGFRSTKAIRDHFLALERKGLIKREPGKARAIRVSSNEGPSNSKDTIPLFGSIPAGLPDNQTQHAERLIKIDIHSLGLKPAGKVFALTVCGDSMVGRGIYDGDIVFVDSAKPPRTGDVVAALIDNEVTLKTFVKKDDDIFLRPENPVYSELMPADELVIQGVACTVIRILSGRNENYRRKSFIDF